MNVYADSAEQILIRGLNRIAIREQLPIRINNAKKLEILERIRLLNKLIALKRLNVDIREAQTVEDAICEQVWDKKQEDIRLDNGTTDVDTMDALEYSIEPYFNELSRI